MSLHVVFIVSRKFNTTFNTQTAWSIENIFFAKNYVITETKKNIHVRNPCLWWYLLGITPPCNFQGFNKFCITYIVLCEDRNNSSTQ